MIESIERLFKGRVNRLFMVKGYAIFLSVTIIVLILPFLAPFLSPYLAENVLQVLVFIYLIVVQLPINLITTSIIVRRLHDFNMSGWWVVIPYINLLFFLAAFIIPGTKGENKYGPEQSKTDDFWTILWNKK